jgi:uncharacterized ferritin-like protein (DUF455 family)
VTARPGDSPTTVRAFAERVVLATSLEEKLDPPPADLPDPDPGPPLQVEVPGRPARLAIVPASAARVPPLAGMADPAQRSRILHAFANHELQAAELFAWALLAFPDAPAAFRAGLLRIVADEQRHLGLYLGRLAALDTAFGDHPVSGYFWGKAPSLASPLRFVCAMSLTFEAANLDHAGAYARAAREVGDPDTADALERIGRDEIRHVGFGWTWLERLRDPGRSAWDAYRENLTWPLRPALSRGDPFLAAPRRAAGIDEAFLRRVEAAGPDET